MFFPCTLSPRQPGQNTFLIAFRNYFLPFKKHFSFKADRVIIGTYSSIYFVSSFLKFFGFSVDDYRDKEAEKIKRKKDKEKLRSMYEQGTI
jgi:hypothetical protein